MFKYIVLISVMTIVSSHLAASLNISQFDVFAQEINNMHGSWTARPLSEETILEILKSLSGHFDTTEEEELSTLNHRSAHFQDIPEFFDARENWPQCRDIIGTITRQGSCGSCWAHTSARVISDRICIDSKGATKVNVSVEDLLTCCNKCAFQGNGCIGGKIGKVYEYWMTDGVVTGSPDSENAGCKPLTSVFTKVAPACQKECTNSQYEKDYDEDKHYGQLHYQVKQKDVLQIQIEIMTHGPVNARMDVMEDLPLYVEGVYRYSRGKLVNPHGVRILGWGVENGTSYWLVANSWGTEFGLNGFLKIVKGENHLKIESAIQAGRVNGKLSAREFLITATDGVEGVSSLLLLYFVVLMVVVFT